MKIKLKILLFLYFVSSLSIIFSNAPFASNKNISNNVYLHYEIQQGDSLWSIADQFNVKNKESFIFEIKKLNNLDNSLLIVKDILLIPSNI